MGGISRHRIFSNRVMAAQIHAKHVAERAEEAIRERDRTACLLWSEQMEGFGGPAQPSPTIAQCINGGYGWLEIMCKRCETVASMPLRYIHRPRDTPIWRLEQSFLCEQCSRFRYRPQVLLIKLTTKRSTLPQKRVHPDDNDRCR